MKSFFYLFMLLLLSCSQKDKYKQETLIEQDDFETTQALTGTTIQFDEIIMNPNRLLVCDSLLIMINSGSEKLFDIFDLKSKKKIGGRISLGQGPDDMIQPSFVSHDKEHITFFDTFKMILYEFSLNDFISNTNPVPLKKTKLDGKMMGGVGVVDEGFVGSTYDPNTLFLLFNNLGTKIGQLGKYPISNIAFSENERLKAYQFSFTTNLIDKIAVCYNWADLIDIYDKSGVLYKRISGPEHFTSQFKEFNDGKVSSARSVPGKRRDAYFNPVNVGNDFFVLFSGKSEDEEGYNILSNQIFVFSWDGEPKKRLLLDQGIFAFTVDDKNKKIYGISNTPEFHVVEFEYK